MAPERAPTVGADGRFGSVDAFAEALMATCCKLTSYLAESEVRVQEERAARVRAERALDNARANVREMDNASRRRAESWASLEEGGPTTEEELVAAAREQELAEQRFWAAQGIGGGGGGEGGGVAEYGDVAVEEADVWVERNNAGPQQGSATAADDGLPLEPFLESIAEVAEAWTDDNLDELACVAVVNALYHATGVRVTRLPATLDKFLDAVGSDGA